MTVTDPRTEAQAAVVREMDRTAEWQRRRRDVLVAHAEAYEVFDGWTLDNPDADAAAREAQRRTLKLDRFAEDLAQLDRMLSTQAARILAARKRGDDVNWSVFVAEDKRLQAMGRDLLQRALTEPPTAWKNFLPELQLVAILVERGREDVKYLQRTSSMYPPNDLPLPGFTESVPQLMRFFGLMGARIMNGLAGRVVVKEPKP